MAKCTGNVAVKGTNGRIERDADGKPVTRPCKRPAIAGGKVCPQHGGRAPQVKAHAAVRAEVTKWGLGDTTVDPAEALLRLLSQSYARAEHYSKLLADAYDAAERLKVAHDAKKLSYTSELGEDDEDGPSAAAQQANADLDRIFNTGGVAALVGQTYSASNTGSVYATGEAIRGLAQLEATERDRAARFAKLALDAGIAERQVRLAEKQTAIVEKALLATLDDLGLPEEEQQKAFGRLAHHLRLVV